jgi:hypothetical protein
MKMIMEHLWGNIDRGETEVLAEKSDPVPLGTSQIGLSWDRSFSFAFEIEN